MRRPDIAKLLFDHIFPVRRPMEPDCWASFVHPNGFLVQEIREERRRFYGAGPNPSIPTLGHPLEAQYPGMDYNSPWHRMRLSAFPWHSILFKALDELELTPGEIDSIMTFEGTKYARQQYERVHGVIIRDTTGDDILPFVEPFLVLRKSSALVSRMVPIAEWDTDDYDTESASSLELDQEEDPPDEGDQTMHRNIRAFEMSLDSTDSSSSDEDEHMGVEEEIGEEPRRPIRQPFGPPVESFRNSPVARYSADQYPDGPPLLQVHETASDIELAGHRDTSIRVTLGFTDTQLEQWEEHALEQGFEPEVDGHGYVYWNVPRRVAGAFIESDTFEGAISKITLRGFYNGMDPFDRRDRLIATAIEESDHEESEQSEGLDDEAANVAHGNVPMGNRSFDEIPRQDREQLRRLLFADELDAQNDDVPEAEADEVMRIGQESTRAPLLHQPIQHEPTIHSRLVRALIRRTRSEASAVIHERIVTPERRRTGSRAARWHPTLRPNH